MARAEKKMVAAHQSRLVEIEQMWKRSEVSEAFTALEKLAGEQDHPCLDGMRAVTEKWLSQLSAQMERQGQRATTVLETAQRHFDKQRYGAVVADLRAFPAALRDRPMRKLLKAAEQALEEVETLKRQVRQKTGIDHHDRMFIIERLLALQPDDQQVRKWVIQIGEHVKKVVVAKIKRHQYGEALDLLDSLPALAVDRDISQRLDQISELAYLASEVELAPTITSGTLEAARRLAQLDPTHPTASQALQEMQHRVAKAKHNGKGAAPEWKECPDKTVLNVPIHHFNSLRPFSFEDRKSELAFDRHQELFAVAAGLALQLLNRAAINLNMLPHHDRSVLEMIRSSLRDKPANSGWGLDLSSSGLKAVRMVPAEDDQLRITRCVFLPHRKSLVHVDTEAVRQEILLDTLRRFVTQEQIGSTDAVAIQWPAIQSLVRFLSIPPVRQKKMQELIQFEVRHQIPFPLADVCWRTHHFTREDAPIREHREVLLVAVKLPDLQKRLSLFEEAGIQVSLVQCDAIALHNYIYYDRMELAPESLPGDEPECLAVCDVGADATNIIFSSRDSLWFRAASLGGNDLSQELVRRFKLTHESAEQVKRQPERARRMSDLHRECCSTFEKIAQQFETSRMNFERAMSHRRINGVLLLGGSSRAPGLLRYLRYGH